MSLNINEDKISVGRQAHKRIGIDVIKGEFNFEKGIQYQKWYGTLQLSDQKQIKLAKEINICS